jgi:hypothetical protein
MTRRRVVASAASYPRAVAAPTTTEVVQGFAIIEQTIKRIIDMRLEACSRVSPRLEESAQT